MTDTPDIEIHDLTIGYAMRHAGRRAVASGLNATARHAALTCLIGRNGTGKSTLLRTIARLQPRLGGCVTIGGRDTDSFGVGEFARTLGIVLTSRPDARNLTVRELVALGRTPYTDFWGRLSADDALAVDRAIADTGMSAMADRRVFTLSDGECQRAMIAKSLAQQTQVILLDEPTAFLDYPGKVDLMMLLRRIARDEGKTILLSTHDIETALQIADHMWLLDHSGISVGSPRQLAATGAIERYIGRKDVRVDGVTLSIDNSF